MNGFRKRVTTYNRDSEAVSTFIMFYFGIVAAIFELLFSFSTSPLYLGKYIGYDSDIFLALGKLSEKGLKPYAELFDHKGPIIYAVESWGYWLGDTVGVDGRLGVWFIQVIALWITLAFVYKIVSLFITGGTGMLMTTIFPLLLNVYYEKGNLTEEYCLPFIMACTYGFIRLAMELEENAGEEVNALAWSFLYGMTFSIGAFTRLTNSLPVAIMGALGAGMLLRRARFVELLKCILGYIAGMAIVAMPVFLRAKFDGTTDNMIYATFTYNFKHGAEKNPYTFADMMNLAALSVALIFMLVVAIMVKSYVSYMTGAAAIVALATMVIGRPYAHYFIVWLPAIVTALAMIANVQKYSDNGRTIVMLLSVALIAVVMVKSLGTFGDGVSTFKDKPAEAFTEQAKDVVKKIPPSERESVVAYNVKAYFYIATDIKPAYRNFILQDMHAAFDEEVRKQWGEDLKSKEAKYIISNLSDSNYSPYIADNYKVKYKNKRFKLWVRK